MPRKKKTEQPIGVGMTAKQMKRRKPINNDFLRDIEPLTQNQQMLFDSYASGKNIVAGAYLKRNSSLPLFPMITSWISS